MSTNISQYINQRLEENIEKDVIFDELVEMGLIEPNPQPKSLRPLSSEILPIGGALTFGVAGFGVAGPPGSAGGAFLGSGLGEFAQQEIEKATGKREKLDIGQITESAIKGGG